MAVVSRYTVALHAMIYIADKTLDNEDYVTSDQIAESVGTSPVFIRRILGMLGKAKLVIVKHGGIGTGWRLAKHPELIKLSDVYDAIVKNPLFERHHSTPSSNCVIGIGIQPVLEQIYDASEAAMKDHLAQYNISQLRSETMKQYNAIKNDL